MKTKEFLLDAARGVSLGVSAAVPGVSAGTIAVVEKIYDKLIGSISNFKKDKKGNFLYLLPIILGAIIGALLAFFGIKKGYDYVPFSLAGLFAGLIIGSLPVVIVELKKGENKKAQTTNIILAVVSFLIATILGVISIVGYEVWKFDVSASFINREWWIFLIAPLAGFIAAGACVVPGISGSMCLFVIGLYQPILNLFMGETSIFRYGDSSYKWTGVLLLVLLVIGAIVGLIVTSKVMDKLLAKKRVPTFYVVFGLIIGSLVTIFLNKDIWVHYYLHNDASGNPISVIKWWDYLLGGILLVAGAALTYYLYKKTSSKEIEPNETKKEEKE
jgi:putative membrane protein